MLDQGLTASSLLSEGELERLLKKDLRFQLIFAAAAVPHGRHIDQVEDLALVLMSKGEFRALRNSLLKHGYWSLSEDGTISVKKSHVDLGELSLHEFTNITLGLLTHLSEDGPCNYENLFIVTTEELKREFYLAINRVLKDFAKKSSEVSGDRVIAWNHIGIDFGHLEAGLMSRMDSGRREEI